MSLAITRGVQPDQHRGIMNDGRQQLAERSSAELAKQLVLAPHEGQVLDLEVARREVVVPKEGQALRQRVGPE